MKVQNPIHILIGIVCIGFLPRTQAVVPAPDGGYPGGNTAEGESALLHLTTGSYNTAIGFLALRRNTDGQFNTGVGAGTLLFNHGDQSKEEGVQNTAIGAAALLRNTTGSFNTATGVSALLSNTTGGGNTANGVDALFSNSTGVSNTAIGEQALESNTTGGFNTATGVAALFYNTTGSANTASGVDALLSNTTGDSNTACGDAALFNSTTGIGNAALGFAAGSGVTTASNVICIGANVTGANLSNSCFIGNIRDVTTAMGDAIPVVIDSTGQLGTTSSSQRFKKEIKPMDQASEAILALKPVTFRYKGDNTHDAIWFDCRGRSRCEPGLGGARREGRNLHGALRSGERDVAERIPQTTPQSRAAGAQNTGTGLQSSGTGSDYLCNAVNSYSTTERNGGSHSATQTTGSANPEGERPA